MFQARPQRSEESVKSTTPVDEDQAAPVPVGERARSEDQRGETERIGVDDPLQASQAGIEALLHVRQRDDHDRDVEQQHERRQADGEQRPLPHAPVRLHAEDGTDAANCDPGTGPHCDDARDGRRWDRDAPTRRVGGRAESRMDRRIVTSRSEPRLTPRVRACTQEK